MLAFFDIGKIVDDKLAQLWAAIGYKWADLWAPISDAWPLVSAGGIFLAILAACLFVGFFLQFKWIRAGLGGVVLLAGAWLAGSVMMYGKMKSKLDAERKKRKR